MAQRNPLNDRYKGDGPSGQTRKSASSAKPKKASAAPSSERNIKDLSARDQAVVRRNAAKTKRRTAATARTTVPYVVPTSPEYKRYRKIWWILIIIGLALTAVTWAMREWMPEQATISYVVLGIAYVAIVGALLLDFLKIRPLRKAVQDIAAADRKAKK